MENVLGPVLQSLGLVRPEIALVAALLAVVLADVFRLRLLSAALTLAGLAAAGALTWSHYSGAAPSGVAFQGAYAVDAFASAFKLLFLASAVLVAILSWPSVSRWQDGKGEFFALLLSCTFGMVLMAGANDLLLMYLALEFVSVTSYILAGMLRKNRRSAEASLKYIIYGSAASGFMIYGMSYLYGMTGTLEVVELGRRLSDLDVPPTMSLITSVLIMAGFGYKIAAVPFHMWCPDVYEGSPTPVTAFFSVGPKAAGLAMLARFLEGVFPSDGGGAMFEWRLIVALMAVLTMAVGNLGALQQQNLKRLLAYSSIAHAGYLLVAFVAFTPDSLAALLFYLVTYVVMNLGAFALVLVLEERYGVETVDGCRGLGWRSPQLGILATIFLFSLTGLPPMAGFAGKFLLFSRVVDDSIRDGNRLGTSMVVVAVLFSVISLYYYLRIAAAMWLQKGRGEEAHEESPGAIYGSMLWFLGLATVGLGIWWAPLEQFASRALLNR
jgi:NADH-quinone oxidoreductase subunit N